jgi:hypothetical protein
LEDLLAVEMDPTVEDFNVRELVMKYDPTFRRCFQRYCGTIHKGPTAVMVVKFCEESHVLGEKPPLIPKAAVEEVFAELIDAREKKQEEVRLQAEADAVRTEGGEKAAVLAIPNEENTEVSPGVRRQSVSAPGKPEVVELEYEEWLQAIVRIAHSRSGMAYSPHAPLCCRPTSWKAVLIAA